MSFQRKNVHKFNVEDQKSLTHLEIVHPTEYNEIDYWILHFLQEHTEPVGAGRIQAALSRTEHSRSEAAIGRILRRFQEEGLVRRIGFQGQSITDRGREYLRQLENERHLQDVAQTLINRVKQDHGEALFHVLQARRAIESEAARLAARKATNGEIDLLEANLDEQNQQLAAHKSNAELNRKFHSLIVTLSHNKLLVSMYEIIGLNTGLARIFERGRLHQGSSLGRDHVRILQAIRQRDGNLATAEVCRHIENTIQDMEQYLALYHSPEAKE